MEKFTFDIQRFDDPIKVSNTTELNKVISNAATDGTETSIKLTGNISSGSVNQIPNGAKITIDVDAYNISLALTIAAGGTLTLTGENKSGPISGNITNNGTLTLDGVKVTGTTINNVGNAALTVTGDSSVVLSTGVASSYYTFGATGSQTNISVNGTLKLETTSSDTATITLSGSNSTYTDSTAQKAFKGSGVTFNYGANGTISIGNLVDTVSGGTHTNVFTITDNSSGATTTYTVVGNSLKEVTSNAVRIWKGTAISQTTPLTLNDLETDSNYTFAHLINDATLKFDGTLPTTPLDAGKKVTVVDEGDFTKKYGTLTKSGNVYKLTKADGDTALSSITISDGSTVEFSDGYAGVEITVNTATTFKTVDVDGTAYTVIGANARTDYLSSVASIGGSTNISLGSSGSVLTAVGNQTVAASSYKIYGYNDSLKTNNGIVIATDKVGDIQVGESFIVNDTTYTRKEYGLTITDGNEEKIFVGNNGEDTFNAAFNVALDDLDTVANFKSFGKFIQPESGVLTVGGKNSVPAVISYKAAGNSDLKKFGEIQVDSSGNYTLTATDGGDISAFATTGTAAIATISVAGGDTTIYKTLSDGRFIATAGKAIFTVQKVKDGSTTFTVNGTNSTPTVKDATEITLYAGSIVTDSNITQIVNLNDAQTITVTKCEMEIAFSSANTFTVTGTQGDVFTLGGKEYTLTGTDGMTFTVTADGITISDLGTVDNDAFSAKDVNSGNTINYSVRGAGFIKEESGAYQIWTPPQDHQHTLTSNTVTVESLTSANNWKNAATVDSDTKAATLPTSTFGYLVDYDDFKNRYGTFKSSDNVYTIETVDSTDKLSAVSVGSDVGVLSMGSGLDNVVIQSSNVTLSVTNSGTDSVYEVTLTGGVGGIATVSTGEKVSLISGALKADSNVPVTYDGNNITANGNAVLTINADSSDATISALEADKSFKVDSAKYTQKKVVGLINESGNYLFGSKQDGIKLSDINNADRWGELIAAGELSITASTTNALVVDQVGDNLSKLYADYEAGKSLLSQSNGGEAWPTGTAITIDTTTVNFSKDFSNGKVTIHAAQSDAEFLVGDGTTFSVTDVKIDAAASASITSYASIGNAHNITQTGGTIYITDAAQTVNTANGTVSSAAGVTVFVSGDKKTTLGAIDVKESLAVDGATYTREQIGFMDSDAKLLLNTADLTKVPVDSLKSNDTDTDNWKKTNAVTNNVLTLPTSTAEDDWIIIDSGKSTVYGSLTSDTSGAVTVDRNDNSFAILANTSKAQFTTDTAKFTVTDGDAGASISSDAELISLTGGIVALAYKNQSIVGGGKTINASSLGTDNVITVNMSSGTAVIGALDAGEIFIVDGETYTLQTNGRFERKSDGKVWNGKAVDIQSGSINVASLQTDSYWNSLAQINSDSNLTIDESKTSVVSSVGDAAYIHETDYTTKIYGTFSNEGNNAYKLSTDGKTSGAEFETITVTKDAPQVTFTNDFKGKTIIADNTATIQSTATSNFTLFYDGTVASVTGSNALTLQNGTLTTDNTTNQVITVGDNTVKAAAGTVTVALKDSTVTVDSINKANDSVIVNGKTYTLTDTAGSGFKINISSGTTTLSDVDNGDKFTIGNDNFFKTSAGLFKTDDNGTPYMWTNSSDFNGVDVSRLTATASTDWTAIVATDSDGVLTIDTNSTTSIVVDSVTDPTMIRGKLTKSGNAVTLETYASTDTKPTAIIVDAATAAITDAFSTIPITATNSAVITTEDDKTLTFVESSGDFSVNGTAYKMTGAGLTKDSGKLIWTAAGVTSYVLPDDSAWSTLLTLDSNGKLDLTAQSAGDGSNVIVDSTSTTRYATLTYSATDKTYNFKKADGDIATIATIALGADTATVTTDFATNVTAQSGTTYTVNGNTYKAASTITVAADANNSSTLDTGTVTIAQGDTVTADKAISVTDSSSSITATAAEAATAAEGKWTSLGDLGDGEKFTVDGNNYQVYGTTALVQLDGDGNIASVCSKPISNGTIAYSALDSFDSVVELESDGTLDLTTDLGITSATVIEQDKPSVKVATLTYDSSTGYTLDPISGGSLINFTGVTLGKNIPQFTTAIATTITASDTGATYTVNGKAFTAQSALTIATDSGSDTTAFLTAGTVTLATGADAVTARRTSGTVTKDETIEATSGTVTVAVTDSTTTTIGDIDNAEIFTVDGMAYLATSIGLAAASMLIKDAATSGSITTDDLTGAQAYVQTTDGVLTIDTTSGTALVVDITTPASAKIFGTLTKNGSAYTLTTDNKTDDLSGIEINGVTATIASDFAKIPITADNGTFTVDATGDFTINATTTPLTFTAVDLITLTEGSLAASKATPAISLKGNTVIVTNGTMTIGYHETSGKAQISGLNNDETFTIDGEEYTVTNGRLFHGEEPVESGFADGVFTIDDANLGKMIAVEDDGTLDLTGDLTSGITYNVYNSLTKPTSKFAELEISSSGTFTLTQSDNFTEGCISTVAIAAGKTLNVDFATTVAAEAPSSGSAVTTVNSVKYNATSALTIAATPDSTPRATLTDGTITLDDKTNKTATSSADNKTLRATEGTFTAVAKDGTFTTVSDLQADDSFTYDGATYTQKALGLMKESNQIREDLTPNSTVTLSTLVTSDNWTAVLTPENGTLDITAVIADKAFVYSDDTCKTKLATLTLADSTFTLKPADADIAAKNISTVAIDAGDTLKVQFATQVDVAKPASDPATTTVNGKEYTSATALTIDATASSSTLNEGTVTIASGDTVTATDTNSLTVTAGNGITAEAEGGSFTTVKDLVAGDSFTWKGDTYTYSTQGLLNKAGQICESLNGTTVDLSDLDGATFIDFLAPDSSGVLTLADGLSGSITVFDDATSPTKKLATLTVGSDGSLTLAKGKDFTDDVIKTVVLTADKTLTVNFTTQVTAPIGKVTVNGNNYVGTTKLTIDSDGTTSTLTQGIVTLKEGSSVTPTGEEKITATAGDGLTIRVASGESGSTVTISGIANGDSFTVGDNTFALDDNYFYKTDENSNRLVYTGTVDIVNKGITLTELSGTTDWGILLEVTDGALTVNQSMSEFTDGITEALVVEKPTGSEVTGAVYGILIKDSDNSFTLTKPDTAQGDLTAITAADVKLVMDADFANAAFTVGSSKFSSIALKNNNNTFTVDATGTAPAFTDNVTSLTLSSGNVMGVANQTVTAGTRSITPTTVMGTMVIDSEEINGLTAGNVFTLDNTNYKVLTISGTDKVFNATSPAIVTAGYSDGTLNFASMAETQALVPTSGVTDLDKMTGNNAIVLNSATTPITQLGTVTKSGSAYTVDFTAAAKVKTPSTAPVTVNGATYNGTALTLDVPDNTTSTLNTGTVTLDATNPTVTATTDGQISVSGTADVVASGGTFKTISDLQADDSFTLNGNTYTQTDLGLMNAAGQIREDLTPETTIDLTALATDWTDLLEVVDGAFTVEADTLTETVPNARLVNKDHTKMYGKLTRTAEATYTLTEADEALTKLTVNGATVTLDPEFRTASIVANGTELSALTLGNTNSNYTLTAATDTVPTFSDNVTAFTLGQGSVIVNSGQTITTGDNVLTATAGSLTVNATTISKIGTGDTFTLNGKAYMLMDNAGLFDVTDSALVDNYANGSVPFGSSETQVVAPVNGVVQLADVTEAKAIVLSDKTASATKLGNVTKTDNVYTVDYTAQVKTPSTSPVTVNGATYNGMALTLDTTADTSTLTEGTVTLANAESVTTTTGNTITATEGDGLTVTAADSTVTLGALNSGDIFTVDGTEYKVTSAGLYRLVDKEEQIYNGTADVLGEGKITVAQLAEDVWGGISSVEDDTIVIDDKTLANGESTKLTNEDGSKVYGELTRDTDGKYTFTKTDDTTDSPTGITINEVTAAIDSDFASVPVTTVNADDSKTTFTATPTKNAETFTVDATGNSPALTDVKAVELTEGALAAEVNQPVTLDNGKIVTPTKGTMTINSDGVSDLAAGDKFTVTDSDGDTKYEVIDGVGLFNATDKALVDDFNDTFDFNATETQILAPNSSGQVELSAMIDSTAHVFDSNTAPTKKLGTVTKSDNDYTVDFATPLKLSAGTFSVNGKDYTATSDVVIQSDGTTSTLTQGTVSLAVDDTVTTTASGTVIKATATGSNVFFLMAAVNDTETEEADEVITVTVNADGTISIGELGAGDIFTVNGKQYKFATAGLLNPDGDIWTGEDFTDSLTLTALENTDNWTAVLEVTNGNLAIDTETLAAEGEVILVDNEDDPIVTYGALVKSSDGTEYTLATDDTSATLNAIAIDNTTVNIDGALASVPVTANENATFTVTPNKTKELFTVDATTEAPALTDNVKTVTLTEGTITAAVKQPVTIGDSTVTPATINGTMIIGTDTIGGLTAGDEFTIDGDSYKVIDGVGLFNTTDKTLADTYADGSMTIGGSETQIIAPNSSGQIELSAVTGDKANVFDSDTAPTTKLGTITKADTTYTIDYSTPVKATAGSFSVNGKDYTATTEAVLQSDGTTSTLTEGTVTIAINGSVTPTGKDTVTTTSGDGLTVNVKDDTVTINGMNDGDTFTVGDTAYKVAAAGLLNGNKIWTGTKDYTDGLTTTDLATAANWTEMLSAPDGALTVKPSTLAEGDTVIVVDNTKNPTKTYGALTKDSTGYTLTKGDDDETLSSITDSGTIIDVDNDLAKVPVTTVVSDGSEATFTVTPAGGTDYFTVDATGTTPKVDNAGSVEVSKGKITAGDGIPVTAADGAEDVDISAGDGTHDVGNKTVKIDGMGEDEEGNKNNVDFGTDSDGNLNSISGLKEGATVTVDGHTYTAPFDDATLKYNDTDGWYFDDYELDEYNVTVDSTGNVSVDEGVQFSKVVASGKTLDTSGTVKFAANITKTPITVINKGTTGLNISDYTGDKLANNLGMTDGVKFSGDTTKIESLSDVAGATFTLDRDQSLTGEDATIIGGADDTEVLVDSKGKFLNIDKAATVSAPSTTELLLGNATYNLNGVELTTGDSTEASLTANGVTVNLEDNEPLKFKGMTVGTGGTATFDTSGNVSLTSGATATNANGNTLTISGTVGIDDKTVTVAEATKVTATANGLNVGEDTLTVTGDEDGYIINISSSSIIGLADIGSSTGVTVGGLDDATVATDKASSLTVDKTFSAPAEVTYTVADGKLVGVTNAASISGDFANGFTVNGTNYSVTGGTATVNTSGNIETGAGTYGINGHTFTTSQPTTFTMNNSSVTGAALDGDGNFAVHQDETSFNIDGNTLTFSGNDNPVTVGTTSGIVTTANGVNGLIDGLTNATVYDVSTATINGTPISITGDVVNVPVTGGAIGTITGLDAGATVNTAPNLTLTATANGTFTFVDDSYNVNDSVDATFDFITDSNSRVININRLSGILSGALDSISVNGQPFASTSDDVTLATDGTNITAVLGLSSGDIIAGSLSKATMTLPEGSVTINGAPFTLAGDSNGVELSDNGTVISGLAKNSTLTVGAADTYNINGKDFAATAGQAYTVNREGVYPINASIMPITETTNAEDILALGASSIYIAPSVTGSQSIAFDSGNNVALIDSANAPTSVKTGTGTDSVVARHGAQATVDVENGTPIIVATNGKVTLDNYNDNADIQTFDYTDITSAVMNNDIKFGDGTMTLGDAVISFGTSAASTGATLTDIIGATGDKQPVGFTHTNGGTLDTRSSSDNFILKGNYAQSSSDTQKGNGSSIAAGSGNDTVLVGAEDTVDAGGGANQIYITDPSLRGAGATIALTSGTNTVHGFNPGFTATSDAIKINDPASLEIGFGNSGLTMASGNAQLMFDGMAAPTVTVAATSDSLNPAAPYELKLTDGTTTYNAAIAQDGKDLAVVNGTTADVFIGADTTGLSFNEYTGAVAVNLGDNAGTLDSSAAQIYGVDKVALGSGNGTLIGAENTNNTLIAGTGNGSIWSDSGNDLMRGNTSADKKGSTDFFYAGGDGKDTIDGFDFMASADDTSTDEVVILPDARVTAVNLSGNDVVIGFNDGTDDALTITNAKDTPFLVNGLITKVDDDVVFDGFTECYVGAGDRPTLTVGEGLGEVDIFLGDDEDTQYLSDIAVLDASAANGEMNFLAGNDTDNLIIGGSGENAIWGGDSFSNDTLVGGSGKNTFFFAAENGNDVIQNAKDGDVVDLTYLDAEQFSAVEVTSDGVAIDLTDGSHLDVQSNASVEYKLGDGNTYLVDHDAGEFNRKEN